jgi:hypothetical protein
LISILKRLSVPMRKQRAIHTRAPIRRAMMAAIGGASVMRPKNGTGTPRL